MSRGNRRAELLAALTSLLQKRGADEQRLIGEYIVINEYDAGRQEDYASLVCSTFPEVSFLQKTAGDRGQARTLNMILDRIQGYDFWIHWEESVSAARPPSGSCELRAA